jgi:hypothetical protein
MLPVPAARCGRNGHKPILVLQEITHDGNIDRILISAYRERQPDRRNGAAEWFYRSIVESLKST